MPNVEPSARHERREAGRLGAGVVGGRLWTDPAITAAARRLAPEATRLLELVELDLGLSASRGLWNAITYNAARTKALLSSRSMERAVENIVYLAYGPRPPRMRDWPAKWWKPYF